MILELKGTKVTIVDKTLGYQGDNLVNTIQVTVDKDSTWNYKLDMYKGKSKCFDPVLMTREGNVCTVQLTNEILSYGGRYIFQLRGYTDTQTYHSDIFESWVNTSIEYQYDCKQGDCECDCKLPTEFYQIENNITEINNHPPYPGDNNKWMIWDVDRHEYVESDIEVIAGGEDYQTKSNLTTSLTPESTDEQYPSAKATYEYGQSIAESAGKINAITVNGTAQTVEDKTAKIIVNKSTVGLGNVDNTSDKDKPISTAQATAIADAKKAGTDAQTNLTAHINDKENPHEVTKVQVGLGDVDNTSDVNKPISTATQTALNGKLDKTAVVDVTVEALKGQAADAKSVYDAIQAAKPDIVTPTAESTDTQAASAKAVWDMIGTGGGGTDISLGVTGASVGDIVKVKQVDANGKPTAWEAAGGTAAEDFALVGSVTLTETASVVSIDLTKECGEIYVAYYPFGATENSSASQKPYLYVNPGIWSPIAKNNKLGIEMNGSSMNSDKQVYNYNLVHCIVDANTVKLHRDSQTRTLVAVGKWSVDGSVQSGVAEVTTKFEDFYSGGDIQKISKISLAIWNVVFGVGTTLMVWGR